MLTFRGANSLNGALSHATKIPFTSAVGAASLLSPLTLVAQDTFQRIPAARSSETVGSAVFQVLQTRGFQSSAVLLGGRYTTQTPEKQKKWRQNLSKKAKKRLKKQTETTLRRAKSMPQLLTDRQAKQTSAISIAQDKAMALIPTKADLKQQSEANRLVIESVTMTEEQPEKAVESLKRVNPVEYRRSLDSAMATGARGKALGNQWNTYLRVLGAHGKLVEATKAYLEMKKEGVEATEYTLCALLTACAQQKNVRAAQSVWESLTGQPIPTAVVDAQADGSPVLESAAEPKAVDASIGPVVVPSSACYGALMQCFVKAQDMPGAFAVMAGAERAGIAMNEPTLWTHLITGCFHEGEYERAIETFEHMRTFHCMPDAHAYTTLIAIYGRMDEVEKVLDVVTEMKQLGPQPNAMTYNAAINAAGRSIRRFNHAHDLFWEMDALGFARDVRSYQGVLLACSHQGDVTRAREYMAHMTGRGIKPDLVCFNTLLTVYARALRDAGKRLAIGKKSLAMLDPDTLAMMKAEGQDLPMLDQTGALSKDPQIVREAELTMGQDRFTKAVGGRSRELKYGHARRVLGPTDDIVDAMLADYFGSSSDRPSEEDRDVAAFENGEKPDSAAFAGPEHEEVIDVQSPEWQKLRSALTASGIVDEGMIDDIEEEYGQREAENNTDLADRARTYERRHRERMAGMEDELLDIAADEALLQGDVRTAKAAARVQSKIKGKGYASSSDEELTDYEDEHVIDVKPSSVRPAGEEGVVGMGGVFADVAHRVEEITGKALETAGRGRRKKAVPADGPPSLAEASTKASSSELILEAAQSGSRIPMQEYLAALEREVMEASFGPQWGYETADEEDALLALQSKAQARALADREMVAEEEAVRAQLGLPREVDAVVDGEATAPAAAASQPQARPKAGTTQVTPSDILSVANLPDEATERHPVAVRGPDGQIRVLRRRWLSMFGHEGEDEDPDVAMLGGVRLKDLFNVNTIPLPPHWKKAIERGAARQDVDFDEMENLDPTELYEHTEAVLRARVQAALIRESMGITGRVTAKNSVIKSQAKRMVDAMSVEKDLFADPLLSENAEEYARIAGVSMPDVSKLRQQLAGSDEGSADEQGAAVPGLDDEDVDGERNDEEDAQERLREQAWETLEQIGGFDGAEGKVARPKVKPAPAAMPEMSTAPEAGSEGFRVPKEGEEIVMSAMSSTLPARTEDAIERAMEDDPDGFTPAQRSHRAFTARVLSRVLAVHPIGPVERLLVEATESADKRRQRLQNSQEPGLLDALFAVQRLKQQGSGGTGTRHVQAVVAGMTNSSEQGTAGSATAGRVSHSGPSSASGSAPAVTQPAKALVPQTTTAVATKDWATSPLESAMQQAEAASEVVRSSPLVQAMVQVRQEAKQAEAKQILAQAAAVDPETQARLKGLVHLSDTLMAGAAWLPAMPYPVDRGEKRQQLLMELSRIYRREMRTYGYTPDRVTLNVMLNAYASAGDSSSAYAFLHDQYPAAEIKPDVRTFRALMKMHVKKREDERALELLRTMPKLGLQPDKDCFGLVVHARARDWRIKEAIALVQEAKGAGLIVPEEYAKLLRQRCKSMGIFHPDIPEHPIGWQFRPEIMKKRFAGAKSTEVRRQAAFLKPVRYKMR